MAHTAETSRYPQSSWRLAIHDNAGWLNAWLALYPIVALMASLKRAEVLGNERTSNDDVAASDIENDRARAGSTRVASGSVG